TSVLVPPSIPALPWCRLTCSQARAQCVRLYPVSSRDWTFCFFPGVVSDEGGSGRSPVSSLLGLGLSPQELSNAPALTHCFWTLPPAQLRTGPSPSALPFGPSRVVAHRNAPSPFVLHEGEPPTGDFHPHTHAHAGRTQTVPLDRRPRAIWDECEWPHLGGGPRRVALVRMTWGVATTDEKGEAEGYAVGGHRRSR